MPSGSGRLRPGAVLPGIGIFIGAISFCAAAMCGCRHFRQRVWDAATSLQLPHGRRGPSLLGSVKAVGAFGDEHGARCADIELTAVSTPPDPSSDTDAMVAAANLLASLERRSKGQKTHEGGADATVVLSSAGSATACGARNGSNGGHAAVVNTAAAARVAEGVADTDDLSVGDVVYYRHRQFGWILVKVIKIDREGAFDGGVTYVIGGAPQLNGAEVETTRPRLHVMMPS